MFKKSELIVVVCKLWYLLGTILASFCYLKTLCDGAAVAVAVATETARRVMAAAAVTAPWHYHPDRIATYVCYLMLANYWLLFC